MPEVTAPGSERCRNQAWRQRPPQEEHQSSLQPSYFPLLPVSAGVLSCPVGPSHSSPEGTATVSPVLFLECLPRCSCQGSVCFASTPLSGAWRGGRGSVVRGTELGLGSWVLVWDPGSTMYACVFWGKALKCEHQPSSCVAGMTPSHTGLLLDCLSQCTGGRGQWGSGVRNVRMCREEASAVSAWLPEPIGMCHQGTPPLAASRTGTARLLFARQRAGVYMTVGLQRRLLESTSSYLRVLLMGLWAKRHNYRAP